MPPAGARRPAGRRGRGPRRRRARRPPPRRARGRRPGGEERRGARPSPARLAPPEADQRVRRGAHDLPGQQQRGQRRRGGGDRTARRRAASARGTRARALADVAGGEDEDEQRDGGDRGHDDAPRGRRRPVRTARPRRTARDTAGRVEAATDGQGEHDRARGHATRGAAARCPAGPPGGTAARPTTAGSVTSSQRTLASGLIRDRSAAMSVMSTPRVAVEQRGDGEAHRHLDGHRGDDDQQRAPARSAAGARNHQKPAAARMTAVDHQLQAHHDHDDDLLGQRAVETRRRTVRPRRAGRSPASSADSPRLRVVGRSAAQVVAEAGRSGRGGRPARCPRRSWRP